MLSIKFDSDREWWVSGMIFERLFQAALDGGEIPPELEGWRHSADANGGLDCSSMDAAEAKRLVTALRTTAKLEVEALEHANRVSEDGSYYVSLRKLLDLEE